MTAAIQRLIQIQIVLIELSTFASNATNSSGIVQLATLSSYQPITPASYGGGSPSNDNTDSSNDNTDSSNDNTDSSNDSEAR